MNVPLASILWVPLTLKLTATPANVTKIEGVVTVRNWNLLLESRFASASALLSALKKARTSC